MQLILPADTAFVPRQPRAVRRGAGHVPRPGPAGAQGAGLRGDAVNLTWPPYVRTSVDHGTAPRPGWQRTCRRLQPDRGDAGWRWDWRAPRSPTCSSRTGCARSTSVLIAGGGARLPPSPRPAQAFEHQGHGEQHQTQADQAGDRPYAGGTRPHSWANTGTSRVTVTARSLPASRSQKYSVGQSGGRPGPASAGHPAPTWLGRLVGNVTGARAAAGRWT